MKAVEEKQDLTTVISSAASELQQLTAKMGMPLNNLGSTPTAPENAETAVAPSQGATPPVQKAAVAAPENPAEPQVEP